MFLSSSWSHKGLQKAEFSFSWSSHGLVSERHYDPSDQAQLWHHQAPARAPDLLLHEIVSFAHLSYLWNIIPFWLAISLKNHTFNKVFEEGSQSPLGGSLLIKPPNFVQAWGWERWLGIPLTKRPTPLHISRVLSQTYSRENGKQGSASSTMRPCTVCQAPTPQLTACCEHTSPCWCTSSALTSLCAPAHRAKSLNLCAGLRTELCTLVSSLT